MQLMQFKSNTEALKIVQKSWNKLINLGICTSKSQKGAIHKLRKAVGVGGWLAKALL